MIYDSISFSVELSQTLWEIAFFYDFTLNVYKRKQIEFLVKLKICKNLHILLQNDLDPMFILEVLVLVVFVSYIMHFRHTLFHVDNRNEMLFTSWKVIKYILKHWSYGVKLFLRQVVFFMHLISHENYFSLTIIIIEVGKI